MKFNVDEFKMFNEEVYEDIIDKIEEANLDNRSDYTVEDFNNYGEVEVILDEEEGTVYYAYGLSEHGCSMLNLNNQNCIANQPPYAEDDIEDLTEEFINKIGGIIMAKKTLDEINEQTRKEIEQFKKCELEGNDIANIYKLNLKNDILSYLESFFDEEDIKVDFDELFDYVNKNIEYYESERMEGLGIQVYEFLEEN